MADADPRLGVAATLAVVVTPGVSTYLHRTLRGVAEQSAPPGTVLVVDTSAAGREIGSGMPISDVVTATGLDEVSRVRIVRVPAARTFGAAVRAALREQVEHDVREARRYDDEAPEPAPPRWLWLLHDDSAPEPQTLGALVRTAESGPSVAIVGAKQRDWAEPDRLLEVGVRATASGRRVPDIEDGEIDQGQHDDREDVLAVGTAGALVRRAVWDELGGTDPALGPFGDGLELSTRVWLAGHRVVLAPAAVVHHARASFAGLRDLSTSWPDPATTPDARRSFGTRRRAQLFVWLASVRWPWLPLVAVAILVLAPVRVLWRLATKEIGMVGAEMRAAAEVLARPGALRRARRRRRRSARVPARYLRPLRASWREVARVKRDDRRAAAAMRSRRRAPSELEIAERAALTARRRGAFWVLLVALSAIAIVTFGPWLTSGVLRGGALAAAEATLGDLWHAATSSWVGAGLGHAGPSDPFLAVLTVAMLPLAPFGADGSMLTTAVLVLSVPLAGVGAWFAAGAASRSVLLRAWATAVWALAPALVLATGQGRLGAVVAHLALPWVALGIARAVGVERRDVVISGMVGARRVPSPVVTVGAAVLPSAGDTITDDGAVATDDAEATTADGALATDHPDAATEVPPVTSPPMTTSTTAIRPAPTVSRRSGGSIAAAAGAGLALAAAAAGAPVLLPAAVVVLLLLALVVPRRRRLALVALPPLLLLGPLVMAAVQDLSAGSWRVLTADPGVPLPVSTGAAWLTGLGWPLELPGLALPGASEDPWPLVATVAGGGAVLVVAVLALLRGTGRARAVRGGWLTAVVGLVVALGAGRIPVGVGAGLDGHGQVAHGWAGSGLSLLLLGLLVAAVSAGDGMRSWLGARSFGWRQLGAALITVIMVAGPLMTTTAWVSTLLTDRGRPTELSAVFGRTAPPVPALATELQHSPDRSRVLALEPDETGLRAEIWRRAGPQLVETSTVVAARGLTSIGNDVSLTPPDEASAELWGVAAQLAAGATTTAGEQLGRFGVGVVIVPPADSTTDPAARESLVAELNATGGLEQVTENESGVIWRVSQAADEPGAAVSVARAQLVDGDGQVLGELPAEDIAVRATVPRGDEGRTVVLAERADSAWQAEYDGRRLRATTTDWRQAFELPAHTGELEIRYAPAWQLPWRIVQGVGLLVVVLLALPVRRRREAEGR